MTIYNNCFHCSKETTNPKFCSNSCAAKHNNKGVRRHGKGPTVRECLRCSKETTNPKYCGIKCQKEYETSLKEEAFKRGEYKGKRLLYARNRWNRKYLSKEFGESCNSCGIEEWNGSPINLEVNHIDGQAYNNVLENLELLCPNCHSQTETFRNLGGRKSDRTYRKPDKHNW